MWGRNVYDAIAKFVQFQLTVNVAAVVIAITGAFTIKKSPLTAVQMLWVNLIMDALAALALATEPPTLDLLKRKPFGRNKRLLSNKMLRFIFGAAFYQLVWLFITLYYGTYVFGGLIGVCTSENKQLNVALVGSDPVMVENDAKWTYGAGHCEDEHNLVSGNTSTDLTQHYTIIFNVFVMMQLFQEINARELKDKLCGAFIGIHKNAYFLSILVATLVLQVFFVMVPGVNIMLDCYAMAVTWQQWLLIMGISFGMLIWGLGLRLITTDYCPKYGTSCGKNPTAATARPWYLSCCFRASGAGGDAKSAYNIGKGASPSLHGLALAPPPRSACLPALTPPRALSRVLSRFLSRSLARGPRRTAQRLSSQRYRSGGQVAYPVIHIIRHVGRAARSRRALRAAAASGAARPAQRARRSRAPPHPASAQARACLWKSSAH